MRWIGKQKRPQADGEINVMHSYLCSPEHCRACPLKKRCTTNPNRGRSVKRSEHEPLVDAHRARMHQILQEMAAWMADNTPGFVTGLTPEQRLRLVHYNVTKQLEYHQQCLMEAWRKSRGKETVRRTTIVGSVRRTVELERPSRGNPRYLMQAGRVSGALLKLAGWMPGMARSETCAQLVSEGRGAAKKGVPTQSVGTRGRGVNSCGGSRRR